MTPTDSSGLRSTQSLKELCSWNLHLWKTSFLQNTCKIQRRNSFKLLNNQNRHHNFYVPNTTYFAYNIHSETYQPAREHLKISQHILEWLVNMLSNKSKYKHGLYCEHKMEINVV